MYLKNGFVGASDGKSSSPVPQPAIRVKDRTREMEVSIQRGMANAVSAQESAKVEREVLTLKRKYSLKRSEDNLSWTLERFIRIVFLHQKIRHSFSG